MADRTKDTKSENKPLCLAIKRLTVNFERGSPEFSDNRSQIAGHLEWNSEEVQSVGGTHIFKKFGKQRTEDHFLEAIDQAALHHCQMLLRRATWILPLRHHWLCLETQGSDRDGEGVHSNQCMNIGRPHFCWWWYKLRSQLWLHLARELSEQLYLGCVPSQQPYKPWSPFLSALPRQENKLPTLSNYWAWLPSCRTRKSSHRCQAAAKHIPRHGWVGK